jgi:predicted nuclease of predicted toxin-antitoxin system
MKFLANENFPLASVHHLREAGHDIKAIIEDSPGIKDSEVLARAIGEERIVLTFDRDYGRLIYRLGHPTPLGIVYFRFDPLTPKEPAEHLLRLLIVEVLTLDKKFTVTDRDHVRQRPLP